MDVKTIKYISSLVRIRLTEGEEEKMKNDLASILEYVDQLSRVDTGDIEPLYQTTGLVNSFRADEHQNDFEMNENLNNKLIGQAPGKQARFVKVKSVLKK